MGRLPNCMPLLLACSRSPSIFIHRHTDLDTCSCGLLMYHQSMTMAPTRVLHCCCLVSSKGGMRMSLEAVHAQFICNASLSGCCAMHTEHTYIIDSIHSCGRPGRWSLPGSTPYAPASMRCACAGARALAEWCLKPGEHGLMGVRGPKLCYSRRTLCIASLPAVRRGCRLASVMRRRESDFGRVPQESRPTHMLITDSPHHAFCARRTI